MKLLSKAQCSPLAWQESQRSFPVALLSDGVSCLRWATAGSTSAQRKSGNENRRVSYVAVRGFRSFGDNVLDSSKKPDVRHDSPCSVDNSQSMLPRRAVEDSEDVCQKSQTEFPPTQGNCKAAQETKLMAPGVSARISPNHQLSVILACRRTRRAISKRETSCSCCWQSANGRVFLFVG